MMFGKPAGWNPGAVWPLGSDMEPLQQAVTARNMPPGSEENPSGAGVSPCAAEADASRAEAEAIAAVAAGRRLSAPA